MRLPGLLLVLAVASALACTVKIPKRPDIDLTPAPIATIAVPPVINLSTPGPAMPTAAGSPIGLLPRSSQPVRSPTPAQAAPAVVEQGFGQAENSVGFAFVVANQDTRRALQGSTYTAILYDSTGTVIEIQNGMIRVVLPGQRLGVYGTALLPAKTMAARMEIHTLAGSLRTVPALPALPAVQATSIDGPLLYRSVGVVTNPFAREVRNLSVAAVAYDAGGSIIGGGEAYLTAVPPAGRADVEVLLKASAKPARVDLYAALTDIAELDAPPPPASSAAVPHVTRTGFGQVRSTAGYAFYVENPSTSQAFVRSNYVVSLFDAAGIVIRAYSATLALILPGEKFAIAESAVLPDRAHVDHMTVELTPGEPAKPPTQAPLSAQVATIDAATYSTLVRGRVVNPNPQSVTKVQAYAVSYGADGAINGAGSANLDLVPGSAAVLVDVYLTTSGPPDHVELYATLSLLSTYQ